MKNSKRLQELYEVKSKHSNYQILSPKISSLLGENEINIKSRFEKERYDFIRNSVELKDRKIIEIGGNTGYFSFEAIDLCSSVTFIEGNKEHCEFVSECISELGIESKFKVINSYFDFNEKENKNDVAICLNVVHHFGDDFGSDFSIFDKVKVKDRISSCISNLVSNFETVIFQMGFCWKGNRELLLFDNGTKNEMIDFVKKALPLSSKISHIGIASKFDDKVIYESPNDDNVLRNDSLGEFLNRPIFIINKTIK